MIPAYMDVTIVCDGYETSITVYAISSTVYRAIVYNHENYRTEYETQIHNHTGTDLELLEKILHGRNLSGKDQV